MSACNAVLENLPPASHIIAPTVMYHGVLQQLKAFEEKNRIRVSYYSAGNLKELKESIDGILAESKKVLENQDASLPELKEAKDSLQKTFEQLGQEAMKNAGAAGAGPERDRTAQALFRPPTKGCSR